MLKFKDNFQLFLSFLKVGSFMFGGGYAMLPLLERELIENKKWITKDELLEILSISQMTPGTIAINAATYIGNKQGGILGGILASAGIILPSLIIVTSLYFLMGNSMTNEYVQKAFLGIRACLVAMIIHSVYKLFKTGIKSHLQFFIFLAALLGLFLGLNPIMAIILGIISGVGIYFLEPIITKIKEGESK
ncbi:chromate transporter [Saccharicrinis aurantiacus]|uniref:chromate transporter n=1 Tax=Saccharicrinis aurantiacus TaxID=1849719 RepID=UPI00094F5DB5|nr:chromate transporter [Saccharicrinis aurantiacus]